MSCEISNNDLCSSNVVSDTVSDTTSTTNIDLTVKAFDIIIKHILNGKSLLLTGKAGTGKSHIAKRLPDTLKQYNIMASITATTGSAAYVVSGLTVHSFMGMTPKFDNVTVKDGKITKDTEHYITQHIRNMLFNIKNKPNTLLRCFLTDVLIIDETSMLHGDTFIIMDFMLRKIRQSVKEYLQKPYTDSLFNGIIDSVVLSNRSDSLPFGGITLVLVADFFQLPPVPNRSHKSIYVFETELYKSVVTETVILNKVIRQSNKTDINILNKIRLGKVDKSVINLLSSRICNDAIYSEFNSKNDTVPIRLYSKNNKVNQYNDIMFERIEGVTVTYTAIDNITGIGLGTTIGDNNNELLRKYLNESQLPSTLNLKVGCQVMLLRNLDTSTGFVNGSLGIVTSLTPTFATVHFTKLDKSVDISHYDEIIDIHNVGSCSRRQLPLKLAYAISIHKSQGQTLNEMITSIDSGEIFSCGQAYVALSRVRDFNGLYLEAFNPISIMADPKVSEFYNQFITK